MEWLKTFPNKVSLEILKGVSSVLAKSGGNRSLVLNRAVQSGAFTDVVDYKFDYNEDDDVSDLRSARSIQALFSKQEEDWFGYSSRNAMTKAGVVSFLKAEERCFQTNEKLGSERPKGAVSVVSYHAVRKIAQILGEVPGLDRLHFSYGPGASTTVKSAEACALAKLSTSPVCSEDMLPFVGEFLAEFPYLTEHHSVKSKILFPLYAEEGLVRSHVAVQVGDGKLTFVPKSVKTKRPIVVEPILNGLAQKGIGSYLKERLLRTCNLDLRDQTRNREAAYRGSVDGSLATIDLSSASDTVSISAVCELLPPEWVDFLSRYRTGWVSYEGHSFEVQKWSSMGNAYTFELESVIFYSLAWACAHYLGASESEVSVFGDDIIVPSECHTLLTEVLDFYGFWVNEEKSFTSGPFRESCGADWFRGCDVRPFYLKKRLNCQSLFAFHNWAVRNGERELASYLLGWINPELRIYGPDGYGDGHLIGSYRLRQNRESRRRGWGGGFFDSFTLRPRRHQERYRGEWLYPLYQAYMLGDTEVVSDPFVVRGSNGYRRTSIYTLATGVFR